ncbi:SusC/RagA family TonB-linked outer membrane protein [Wenyingzhuangia sp. IMCC45574]
MRFKLFENKKLRCVVFTLISVFSFNSMQAQTRKVAGSVTDEKGEPLIGVSVSVKSTGKLTITDFDGNFEIPVKKGDVLVADYLGYGKKEIKVKDQSKITIVLSTSAESLDAVVVVGYGKQTKKEVTGSVVRVQSEQINKIATADVGTALQGTVSGVNVVASSGEPGEAANVIIRGVSSLNGSNSPLYVVDGIPFEGDPQLSTSEIESIDVLKDASAAIYGTRGAAGVILITTNKGKVGEMSVRLNSYYGVQKITSGTALLNREDRLYSEFIRQQMLQGTTFGNTWTRVEDNEHRLTYDTNFIDIIENDNAPIQSHNLSVSGGSKGLTYNVNLNYFSQEGVLIKTDFQRYNLRANTQFKKGKWKIDTGLSMRVDERLRPPFGLLRTAISWDPLRQAITPGDDTLDGDPGDGQTAENFSQLGFRLLERNTTKDRYFDARLNARYDITEALSFTTRASASFGDGFQETIRPNFYAFQPNGDRVITPPSEIRNTSTQSEKTTWESILNYNKKFGKHKITLTGVYSAEKYSYSQFLASKQDIFDNSITVINGATSESSLAESGRNRWTWNRTNALLGALGRVQYNYDEKYLLSASIRRDGSSRFRKEAYGEFRSLSLGWNVSEESFWAPLKSTINSFKVRASSGETGNQGIQDYSYAGVSTLQHDYLIGRDPELVFGAIQEAFENQDVKWETSVSRNLGIDVSFFKNKFTLTADIYKRSTEDMLFPIKIAPSNGAGGIRAATSSIVRNVGDMENKGLEVALKYRKRKGKFKWDVAGNFTMNRNEVTNLGPTNNLIPLDGSTISGHNNDSDLVSFLAKGYEAGSFFLHKTNGVVSNQEQLDEYLAINPDAKFGDLIYVDQNGDGEITDEDKTYAGSGQPDFEAGINFNANYKGFDMSVQMYGSFGAEILNGNRALAYKSNTHQDLVHAWTLQNPNTSVPVNRNATHNNVRSHTDYWVEDGTFVRLRNIVLGYSFPKKTINSIGLNRLRVYVASQNPLTITKYKGYDPEVGGNGLSTRGIDRGNYPVSAQIRGGLQLQF